MKLMLALILAAAAAPAPGACVPVSSDKVVAGDLVGAVPLFQELPPDTLVGYAPLPGTVRVVSGRELTLLALRHGVILPETPDVCIARALRVLTRAEIQAALEAALGIRDAKLTVEEFSSQPLPPGRLEFQRSTLSQPPLIAPDSPVIWRGTLVYDQHHSAAVWAKVRITVDRSVFVAAQDIAAGATIRDDEVQTAMVSEFPFPAPTLHSPAEIAGKAARRSIRAGQRIMASALEEAKDVVQGDIVQVRVVDGLATLSFDGIAASSGKKGDTILVHNSASGRNFRAVVEEKGKAIVRPSVEE